MLGWNPRVGLGSFSRGSKEVGCFPVPPKHLLPAQSSQCQGKQILRRDTKAEGRGVCEWAVPAHTALERKEVILKELTQASASRGSFKKGGGGAHL